MMPLVIHKDIFMFISGAMASWPLKDTFAAIKYLAGILDGRCIWNDTVPPFGVYSV